MYCKICGKEIDEGKEICAECEAKALENEKIEEAAEPELTTDEIKSESDSTNVTELMPEDNVIKKKKCFGINKIIASGFIVVVILLLGIVYTNVKIYTSSNNMYSYNVKQNSKIIKYEYCTRSYYPSESKSRSGNFKDAASYQSIDIPESELNSLGAEGWEVAGCYIENETAFPNFGNSDYVTGLQPNVRPQRVVVIFKRPIK